jgi:Trk K+ transport system NAD-binding subunit
VTSAPDVSVPTDHVVLCGFDGLGLRTLEELHRLGESVVVITRAPQDAPIEAGQALGARFVAGSYRSESVLRAAGVARARALVIVEDDDVGNLHAALTAQEINPKLRIVLRTFNLEFGHKIEALFHDCAALSSSAIAAPAFVAAALRRNWNQEIQVDGQVLVVRRGSASEASVLLPLARANGETSAPLFPASGDDLICLAMSSPELPTSQRGPRRSASRLQRLLARPIDVLSFLTFLMTSINPRFRYLVTILVAIGLVSISIFHFVACMDPIDALYFTVTIITTTGFGDINLRDAPPGLKLYGTFLMLFGAATLAAVYALITDAIVREQLARVLGGVGRRMRDHIVVCGVGNVGYRVAEQIAELGWPVVAVELRETARFLPAMRRLGVPVLIGDARLVETLRGVQVAEARCLIAVTNDDVANLEAALSARALNPKLRVVLRLFDPDFATRVERSFDISVSRSVSALAAPAFAAAAIGRRVIAAIPAGAQVALLAHTRIAAGCWAEGKSIDRLEERAGGRAVALTAGAGHVWCPDRTSSLAAGDELLIVATREGLAHFVANTEEGSRGRASGP